MFGLPLPIIHWLIFYGISFILLAMIVRAVASWFRIDERFAIIRFLARITSVPAFSVGSSPASAPRPCPGL